MKIAIIAAVCLAATVASAALTSTRPAAEDGAKFFSAQRHVPDAPQGSVSQHSFACPLDHFDGSNAETFVYNYRENMQFYQEGGPLFFFIHDLGDHSNRWIQSGLMVDLARQLGAALFVGDHRYSGENIPTENLSVDSLRFLTVENILSDIAHQITEVRNRLDAPDARVILWGSDIGAKIAVWMRQRYPHLVHAAWSSSGRFQADSISESFYNQLSWNIHNENEVCQDRVEQLFATMLRQIEAGESEQLQEALNLCDPIDAASVNDVAMFMEGMIYHISDYVDTNHHQGLHSFCSDLNRYPDDVVRSFARWREYIWGSSIRTCWHYNYDATVAYLRNETLGGTFGGRRQFHYAHCSQLGYLKVSSDNGLFPNVIPAEYQFDLCRDIFGDAFTSERLERESAALDIQYGSRQQLATNVVYTNGELDSWMDHGITDDVIPGSHVINLPFSAQSADLESIEEWQPAAVIAAKQRIMELITEWSQPL